MEIEMRRHAAPFESFAAFIRWLYERYLAEIGLNADHLKPKIPPRVRRHVKETLTKPPEPEKWVDLMDDDDRLEMSTDEFEALCIRAKQRGLSLEELFLVLLRRDIPELFPFRLRIHASVNASPCFSDNGQ
jgi:hypothetical protein